MAQGEPARWAADRHHVLVEISQQLGQRLLVCRATGRVGGRIAAVGRQFLRRQGLGTDDQGVPCTGRAGALRGKPDRQIVSQHPTRMAAVIGHHCQHRQAVVAALALPLELFDRGDAELQQVLQSGQGMDLARRLAPVAVGQQRLQGGGFAIGGAFSQGLAVASARSLGKPDRPMHRRQQAVSRAAAESVERVGIVQGAADLIQQPGAGATVQGRVGDQP